MDIKNLLLNYFEEELINEILSSKRYKRITDKKPVDIELCKNLYLNFNLPIYKIAMFYGVSDATMRTYLLKQGVNLKGHYCGKNSFNNYFETIDSPDKAYFLGLIVADGCILDNGTETNNKKVLNISLTEEDKYILELFNQYANFKTELSISHKEDLKPRYQLIINSSKIYNDLYNLNVRERKSTENETSMPLLKDELIPHFIRGVFDGDGIAKTNGAVGFCGCFTLLNQIKDYLVSKGLKDNQICFNKSNNIYYIQWGAKKDRQLFFDLIYKDKLNLYLIRKFDKIKNKL